MKILPYLTCWWLTRKKPTNLIDKVKLKDINYQEVLKVCEKSKANLPDQPFDFIHSTS